MPGPFETGGGDDDILFSNKGGGAPRGSGGSGSGSPGGALDFFGVGNNGFNVFSPYYSGQGGGSVPRRRWQYAPFSASPGGPEVGGGLSPMGDPGQMFAGQNSGASGFFDSPGWDHGKYIGGGGAPRPVAPVAPQAPAPGPGRDNGYMNNGTFDLRAFLSDLQSGHYFDRSNDAMRQLFDQRGAADERNAVLGATSEFANDPSMAAFARLQARQNSGRTRTMGMLGAQQSQQDWINNLLASLGSAEYQHKINMDAYNRTKPRQPQWYDYLAGTVGQIGGNAIGGYLG